MADGDLDYAAVWVQTLQHLEADGMPARQRAYLQLCRLVGVIEGLAIITAPNTYTKQVLEHDLRDALRGSLGHLLTRDVQLSVSVDDSLQDAPPVAGGAGDGVPPSGSGDPGAPYGGLRLDPDRAEDLAELGDPPVPAPGRADGTDGTMGLDGLQRYQVEDERRPPSFRDAPPDGVVPPRRGEEPPPGTERTTRLNPKYIFETFVIGASNRFAHAAAIAVAEAPAKAYNPLFIYGDSGLGKTHLLHAIGHYARQLLPHLRVRYVNSEEFTNDFINSIRDDRTSRFQSIYRDVDVLLIDDIQFLQGKVQTQEEFFHTFNALHNASKQVVITSDLPPKQLSGFEGRLRSRFEWGLITDVQPPDLETRIAILRKKAIHERMSASDDVLEFIASRISTNIRELEGALIRVTAFANLNRQPVSLDLAEIVLRDLIPNEVVNQITPGTIMAQTAAYYGFTIEDLCSASRSRQLVTARQIAMYLCRELTELSLPKIGQHFGGRDHTTVMHADRKIRELMGERRAIYNQVTEITNRIKQQQH
ncbi:chromosomal replication initiator protein DnaA [Lapillicoccus jejuensis]|uniref:Chromosomal replication initiator protein DnaA n=1 Tax=Lapillicoccus jejuensis TaxID=402171 RepID=A0A542DZ28_9MICO|nr:chromosomal replication initiator protein DnaA [Lapillicoccus jejuensis]TQJ08350.1 chromosomal replication initiator protein DnaA [Lapillicoccus jejuensis]